MPCAESTDGDGRDSSPSEFALIFTATDDNLAEVAMDAHTPATAFATASDADFIDARDSPTSKESSGANFSNDFTANVNREYLAPLEAERTIDTSTTQSAGAAEKEGDDPSPFRRIPDMQYATIDDVGDVGVGDAPADEQSPEAAEIEACNVENAANDECDEFGDFGDFVAFEDAVVKEMTPLVVASGSQRAEMVSSADDNASDEFGDFGEFEKFDSAPEKTDVITDSCLESRKGPLLNESVRRMFRDVFEYNDPTAFSLGVGGTCSQIPFDVPMSKILVSSCFLSLTPRRNSNSDQVPHSMKVGARTSARN